MEPWEEEMQRQWQWERMRQRQSRCRCCGEPITTERYLDLTDFGLNARSCEECVHANWHETVSEGGSL